MSIEGLGLSEKQKAAIAALDLLTDEERQEVLYFYCSICGVKRYRKKGDDCYCDSEEFMTSDRGSETG